VRLTRNRPNYDSLCPFSALCCERFRTEALDRRPPSPPLGGAFSLGEERCTRSSLLTPLESCCWSFRHIFFQASVFFFFVTHPHLLRCFLVPLPRSFTYFAPISCGADGPRSLFCVLGFPQPSSAATPRASRQSATLATLPFFLAPPSNYLHPDEGLTRWFLLRRTPPAVDSVLGGWAFVKVFCGLLFHPSPGVSSLPVEPTAPVTTHISSFSFVSMFTGQLSTFSRASSSSGRCPPSALNAGMLTVLFLGSEYVFPLTRLIATPTVSRSPPLFSYLILRLSRVVAAQLFLLWVPQN